MSPELIATSAAAIGGGLGYLADKHAVNKLHSNSEAMYLSAVQEAVRAKQSDSINEPTKTEPKKREILVRAISSTAVRTALAFSVAATFGIEAYTLTQPDAPTANPNLELVVDDSGSVSNVLPQVKKVVSQFDSVNPETLIGNLGLSIPTKSKKFNSFVDNPKIALPAGDAPLYDQTNFALGRIVENSKNTNTQGNGEVVVVTNGNRIGDINSIIGQAKEQQSKVYVVNVERDGTSSTTLTNLHKLAYKTGGKFWSANVSNLDSVAKSVKTNTTPQKEHVQEQNQLPYQILGLFPLIVAGSMYFNRRNLITGKNPKGE